MARKSSSTGVVVLVVLGVVGILFVIFVGVGVVSLVFYKASQTVATQPTPIPRDEFRKAVVGKTEAEVLELFGTPNVTSDSGGQKMWQYTERTYDPITKKTDSLVSVFFRGGVVESVLY